MKLIKLDAIDSTNDFLKGLASKQDLENFTVVTAESQSKGKGQMGAVWTSEKSKNLIMSVLIKNILYNIDSIFNLNIAVSLAVISVLEKYQIPKLSIKWPNDIMSDNKKIGGILIENSIKSDGSIFSIVGLGLNVNQTKFENLPKASSLACVSATSFNISKLVQEIVSEMKEKTNNWPDTNSFDAKLYTQYLFKKEIPTAFSLPNGTAFMGLIQGVSGIGKLQVLLEDDSIQEFDIKEIQMLY
ncbi:biotin--[acetyl-CoA-carboxylase] ligase [Flavobacterium sp. CHNK8]|uniref:biotin--[acetyl-CoA-carboxylase] ligase n=1 Tax=Flavobacterium sp. CHNK8 TaxID=2871165 RepID=UPI001C8EA422|nr:biotin--[acetyl-CoA-carboxylase] ligase [Flavobacterium sp. CHNK8]QZK90751.1 biotin--[acetyl-CoA-carboxylase] ligase [Flavobacterium sp. CHNK8]